MDRRRFIKSLLELVSIKSFTGDEDGIKECQDLLMEISKKRYGFNSYRAGNGKVVIIEPQEPIRPIKLGLVVHLDTVPFVEKEWTHNPLGEISEDRVYGRGVIDDKGAIVQCLEALDENSNMIQPSWQIIVGSSEEGEWNDMSDYLAEKPELPQFMITVDGDGIQNGCKGTLNLEMIFERVNSSYPDESKLLRFEVLDGKENVVPSKAVADISGYVIEKYGKSAHSSEPELGVNALVLLARKLKSYKYVYEQFPGLFNFLNTYDAYGTDINEYNCSSPTMCFLEGDTVKLNLNMRLNAGVSKEDVYGMVKSFEEQYDCKTKIKELILPAYVDPDSTEMKLMLQAYKKILGVDTKVNFARGTGYNAALPNCAIFGPRFSPEHDEADLCHCVDENRCIDDMMTFIKMLSIFIQTYLM
jgi:succinyl-diaminopimelate desuccinylase